jgi:hypothetical protein
MVEAIVKFIRKHNDLVLGASGFLVWIISVPIFHWLDPTAATYDLAVWQKIIFGLVTFNVCTFNVLLLLKIVNPGIFRYLTEQFDKDFSTLTNNNSCDKLKFSLAVYALYLLALLLSMQVL